MLEYDKLINDLSNEFSGFEIIPKNQSILMKIINVVLKILSFGLMKTFMTTFVTTIGSKVYVPASWETEWDETSKISVLRHERVHILQKKKYSFILFAILYLFVPLPIGLAYFRKKFEQEAYEETMRATAELRGAIYLDLPEYKDFIIGQFVSANYLWTWLFRKSIESWYDQTRDKILLEVSK